MLINKFPHDIPIIFCVGFSPIILENRRFMIQSYKYVEGKGYFCPALKDRFIRDIILQVKLIF